MLIHPWDAGSDEESWGFVRTAGFGHLIAGGRDRDVPVVVPTQYVVDEQVGGQIGDQVGGQESGQHPQVLLHLARPNPVWKAIQENPRVLLAVAGDWAYIPAQWKAVGDEDPGLGIPTTYYAAVQISARAEILDDPHAVLEVLRAQLASTQPEGGHADPSVHIRRLSGILGLRLTVDDVRGKFKYGGNVDGEHRLAVADRLRRRGGPGDEAARTHLLRRSEDLGRPADLP